MKPSITFDIKTESETFGLFLGQLVTQGIAFSFSKEGSEITFILS